MVTFINGLDLNNEIILVAIKDDGSINLTGSDFASLELIGALTGGISAPFSLGLRDSFALIRFPTGLVY